MGNAGGHFVSVVAADICHSVGEVKQTNSDDAGDQAEKPCLASALPLPLSNAWLRQECLRLKKAKRRISRISIVLCALGCC